MNVQRLIQYTAATIAVAGMLLLAPFGYFWLKQKQTLASATPVTIPAVAPKPTKPDVITGKPVHLAIDSVSIAVPVVDGSYHERTKSWDLSLDKAHYALPTVQPNNEAGNTFIYGHYRPEVFAYLHNIKAGATLSVDTDNGYRFTYTFRASETVNPADTSIFAYEGKPRLTIQTCTGKYMENRQLYYFDFTSVEKQ